MPASRRWDFYKKDRADLLFDVTSLHGRPIAHDNRASQR
jgi:hypothetical protein